MMPRAHTGWTPASLLPNIAAGFSPGAAYSGGAPAQVTSKPVGQQAALAQSTKRQLGRQALMSRVLGSKPQRKVL